MPDPVERGALGLGHAVQPKLRQDAVQNAAVQRIHTGPAQLALAHQVHRRLVALAPGQCKGVAIHLRMALGHLALDAAVPVDDRAKDVKRQNLGEGYGHGRGSIEVKHGPACASAGGCPIAQASAPGPKERGHKKSDV